MDGSGRTNFKKMRLERLYLERINMEKKLTKIEQELKDLDDFSSDEDVSSRESSSSLFASASPQSKSSSHEGSPYSSFGAANMDFTKIRSKRKRATKVLPDIEPYDEPPSVSTYSGPLTRPSSEESSEELPPVLRGAVNPPEKSDDEEVIVLSDEEEDEGGPAFTETNRRELRENGFTVIEGVLSPEQCEHEIGVLRQSACYKKMMEKEKEKEDNFSSLAFDEGIAWDMALRRCRLACLGIFENFWKTPALLSSFDTAALSSGTFKPYSVRAAKLKPECDPAKKSSYIIPNRKGSTQWHTDTSMEREGLHALQGILSLTPAGGENPYRWGTELARGSHLRHAKGKHSSWKGVGEFYTVTNKSFDEGGYLHRCSIVRPKLAPGSLLLFDSRTVHRGAPPVLYDAAKAAIGEQARFTVMVSFVPHNFASPKDINMRDYARQHRMATTHWVSGTKKKKDSGPTIPPRNFPLNSLEELIYGERPYNSGQGTVPIPKFVSFPAKDN